MKMRCLNPRVPSYRSYGGRGITVCERWLKFKPFLEDMGERPAGTTIERIDLNGNYEPGNCRWATRREQGRNKRRNVFIEFRGERRTISDWAECFGVEPSSLGYFAIKRGLSLDEAIPRCRGEIRDFVKLSDEQVQAILVDPRTQTAIAQEFGVHQSTISDIKNGKTRTGRLQRPGGRSIK
jgi:hypothetical protein